MFERIKKILNLQTRSVDKPSPAASFLLGGHCPEGYMPLSENPEVKAGVERIAEIVSQMTIHLMENTDQGDTRIRDGLSDFVDIRPSEVMTRQLFISWVVQEMLLYGNAIVLPKFTRDGLLRELVPLTQTEASIESINKDYVVHYGNKTFKSSQVLNFRYNPRLNEPWLGKGQQLLLSDIAGNLNLARKTESDFMRNRMMPSVIIKVDGLTGELEDETQRAELERRYLTRSETGQPWIIPGTLIDVQQIKPMTLKDVALTDNMTLNKQSVASILGIPAFLLGVGNFNRDEYNNFISTKISVISKAIEQEMTVKLIVSHKRYFRFNSKSLLSYSLPELIEMYSNLYQLGIVDGNEVRDACGMSPRKELTELTILENYIPVSKIGEQKKLKDDESQPTTKEGENEN